MRVAGLLVGVVLALAYCTSYLALVDSSVYEHSPCYPGQVAERYPLLEKSGLPLALTSRMAFSPLNWCDRKVRPAAWAVPACVW